ncbi:MAG: HNH endonuclease [Leptolyngbyaceae cyanobacterium SL_7_1]|nr:HNH endonuclease [Leptolyngbyaceae cyanobacterium SL_7_1]
MDLENKDLRELFELADGIGKKQYHRLTRRDFEYYKQFDQWRCINGKGENGSTQESIHWVRDHSDWYCPVCEQRYADRGGRTIDHKLPRAQYPWLALDFRNLWVICRLCNEEKAEMHWYEYEHYMFVHHPDRYSAVKDACPNQLLRSLKT